MRLIHKIIKSFVLPALVLLCFASCETIKEVECTGAESFKIYKVNTEGIDAEIGLKIRNPNHFRFKILPSEFDITYGGVKIGKARLVKKVRIAANTEQVYPFELKSDFKSISLTDVLKLLENMTRKGVLEVKGELKAGKFLARKSFPVNIKEKIMADN